MKISSQHTFNEDIVESYIKRINDGETFVAVIATLENDDMMEWGITALLVDGHHRLEAYRRLGLDIEFIETEIDYQSELDHMGMEDFLAAHWNDGDWYDVETGANVF